MGEMEGGGGKESVVNDGVRKEVGYRNVLHPQPLYHEDYIINQSIVQRLFTFRRITLFKHFFVTINTK